MRKSRLIFSILIFFVLCGLGCAKNCSLFGPVTAPVLTPEQKEQLKQELIRELQKDPNFSGGAGAKEGWWPAEKPKPAEWLKEKGVEIQPQSKAEETVTTAAAISPSPTPTVPSGSATHLKPNIPVQSGDLRQDVYIRGVNMGIMPKDSSGVLWKDLIFYQYCRENPPRRRKKYLRFFIVTTCEGKKVKTEGFQAGDHIYLPADP